MMMGQDINQKNTFVESANKMMLSNKQEESLVNWFDHSFIDADKTDVFSEIDRTLTIQENKNILLEKFKENYKFNGKEDIKQAKEEEKKKKYEELVNEKNSQIKDIQITELFNKPKIIGLIANSNEGKSNTIYWLIEELKKKKEFKLFHYGLRSEVANSTIIHSVEELEQIKDSLIVIDEMFSLFDLDNRKIKSQIENTIRLIFHNNNILLLCGLGENFKKFLSAKLTAVIYKKITFSDLINGSRVKNIVMNYKGSESGSTLLNLDINEALSFDGKHYNKFNVPYMEKFDSKKNNVQIFVKKSVHKIVEKKCSTKSAVSATK